MIIMKGTELKDDNENVYVIEDQIGKPGGFGIVYLARNKDNKKYAIKTIQHSFPTVEDFNSFKNEIQTAMQISSPHVIKYEFAHDGTLFNKFPPYIIMEYATNGNLTNLIDIKRKNKQFFDIEELVNIFKQLAEGMRDINKRLVHRDIKTDNILVTEEGLKICDFGLAKFVIDDTRTMSFKGYGTAKYIAPEAWGNGKNTIQMDIYSMGIVFYEIATTAYPYKVTPPYTSEVYREAHLFQAIIKPNIYNNSLPAAMTSLIVRMLEKPLNKRFSNWDEIINGIKSITSILNSPTPISGIVEKAVNYQVDKDIARQKEESLHFQKVNVGLEFCKKIFVEYTSNVYNPIEEYIIEFNKQYSNGKMKIDPLNFTGSHFVNKILLPDNRTISIEMQSLPESFKKKELSPIDTWHTVEYYPQCANKRILAWGKVEAQNGSGYNLLILDNGQDEYGEWWELHNTNSGLGRSSRISPFGFSIDELPREIELINAVHIYNSKLEKFNIETLYNFINDYLKSQA